MLEENLIDVHFALGYQIRHEFGLWTGNSALLESCRIISGDKNLHVDNASMLIVKALWEKVKKENILEDKDDSLRQDLSRIMPSKESSEDNG